MATLVDSNVILDLLTEDPNWLEWSSRAIEACAGDGDLLINPIICAEVSIGFETFEEVERALPPQFFQREDLPWEAAFLAGKCFLKYRQRGGTRRSTLPDFYIGAHAQVRNLQLLTRDKGRYSTYFPTVSLISP